MKNRRKFQGALLIVCLACILAFFVPSLMTMVNGSQNLSATTQIKEIDGYKKWTRVNSVPQLMPERVSALCAPHSMTRLPDKNNPHSDKYLTVYVNDIGRDAMLTQKNPEFPEGSVIVKESP